MTLTTLKHKNDSQQEKGQPPPGVLARKPLEELLPFDSRSIGAAGGSIGLSQSTEQLFIREFSFLRYECCGDGLSDPVNIIDL